VQKWTAARQLVNPQTIGEHLRNRRLELGLLQKHVAALIGVSEDCISYWENNRSNPATRYFPNIIKFLEYIPVHNHASNLAEKIKLYRFWNGMTQRELAIKINVNESTILHYEKGNHEPSPRILAKLTPLLNIMRFE
jgi:DNA-binding XRE family transcriptional regulator